MTSHNEAQDGITLELKNNVKATLYTGLKLEKRHIDMIGEAIDLKHEAQKTKADWLRSEIEKLEGMKHKNLSMMEQGSEFMTPRMYRALAHNDTLTSIITRYKEELLELDIKKV